ncbi:MAG: dTDP-4-dehydrorhamnose reductase [Coriobacteriia bacterium]|nr:dTDP-4-dehydrorhamnose reductase [Coriobacteriia bacterium]
MKLLICGAQGQLGSVLSAVLAKGASDLGALPSVYKDAQLVCAGADELDITDEVKTQEFIRQGAFDLIINCAAMTQVDACETQEAAAYQVNAVGALNVAKAAEQIGAKLVQMSTDYVFSGDDNKEYVETDPTNPQSAYGRTKLAGERAVLENCKTSFVVRTAWLFGATGPNFVLAILDIARSEGEITVVNDQYGNPTYAHDLAHEILRIAEGSEYGVYHCTSRGVCSWFDFASAIVDMAGVECIKHPCTTKQFARPAKRPAYAPLKNKRLEDTIGCTMRSWQTALAVYLEGVDTV